MFSAMKIAQLFRECYLMLMYVNRQTFPNMVKGEITSEQFSSLMVKNKARCVSLHELATKINESQEFQIQYAGLSGLSYILEARKI